MVVTRNFLLFIIQCHSSMHFSPYRSYLNVTQLILFKILTTEALKFVTDLQIQLKY